MTRSIFIRKWLGNRDKPNTEQFRDEMLDDLDKLIAQGIAYELKKTSKKRCVGNLNITLYEN